MERQDENSSFSYSAHDSDGNVDGKGELSVLNGNFFLDYVGEVFLALSPDGLSWRPLDSLDNEGSTCLGIGVPPEVETVIKFSDVYAVEFANYGLMNVSKSSLANAKKCFPRRWLNTPEMCRFTVYGLQKSHKEPCLWKLTAYTFGHVDLETCQTWIDRLNHSLNKEVGRPRNLLVFVHPRSGKGKGCKTWETVAPIFSLAKVKTKVIVTERAGHAFDIMASIDNKELLSYDGVIAVGGDGFFNEIFNGFLLSRLKVPLPPTPPDSFDSAQSSPSSSVSVSGSAELETNQKEDHPLLQESVERGPDVVNLRTASGSCEDSKDPDFLFEREKFRFGIIPAGSTDAIVMCTTGARDPITSALHIVLGRKVCLDAVQVVRWKTSSTSKVEPCVRYAASFAGYGFYGDVISESERYRWMGPKRYDYVGTKVFLKHRSYEAEVTYEEVEPESVNTLPDNGSLLTNKWPFQNSIRSEKVLCRANCSICNSRRTTPYSCPKVTRWSRSKGRFLSIGAAVMSNRNERAPDGLVADAHLSDGFLHLILIKDCSRPMYLWHLTELAKRGGDPLNFDFIEHHKTRAFTFTSCGKESVWNLDGEMFPAHQLSAQVLRGLICLFASGPEI